MPYDVTHRSHVYRVVDDRTSVTVAAVIGQLVDEITAGPLPSRATVTIDRPGFVARAFDGGWFVVSALPHLDLPLLGSDPYTLVASIRAATFQPLELTVTLPAAATLPLELGPVPLRRQRVQLRGRVTHRVTGAPIADALVFATGVAGGSPLLVTRQPQRAPHATGTSVRRRRLDDTPTVTQLAAPARGGATTIAVSSRTGLADGDLVRLGTAATGEYTVVETVSTEPANPALPGDLELRAPLFRGFPATTDVRRINPDVVPQTRATVADADAGDGVLLLDGAIDPNAIETVEVLDGTRTEYHTIGALTDSDGFYHLYGIGRVGALRVIARSAGLSDGTRTVAIDPGRPTTDVNLQLEP